MSGRWDLYDKTKYCTAKEAYAIYGISKPEFHHRIKRSGISLRKIRTKKIQRGCNIIYLYRKQQIMKLFYPYLKPLKTIKDEKKNCVDVVPEGFVSMKELIKLYNLSDKQIRKRIKKFLGVVESVYSRVKLGTALRSGHGTTVARFFNHEHVKQAIDSFEQSKAKA